MNMIARSLMSALALTTVVVQPALAQSAPPPAKAAFNWEVKDGQVVRKATDVRRTDNSDGSWREESKEGSCSKTVEHGKDGSIKTTRAC
ncbi:hypothetical protein HMF7854_00480 [Sphingomonas ginkgonis]|uniref:Uncharacterized protein n=1 Tax=Sphingomonas ginkgonis TaxID=2315330 RepID=A0A3R9Y3P1_9SPHN|nr:hypothetical protein [Sphingomonas ginkgonis]RST29472.1 hypothetical protein HMF7854_00480 [Sphingomonas ginkgonis]